MTKSMNYIDELKQLSELNLNGVRVLFEEIDDEFQIKKKPEAVIPYLPRHCRPRPSKEKITTEYTQYEYDEVKKRLNALNFLKDRGVLNGYNVDSSHHRDDGNTDWGLTRLQTDYNQANTRLSKLYDLKLDGGIPEEIFKTKENEYQNNLVTLKSQMASVEKVNPNFFEDACKILELSKSLHSQYLKADHHEKGNLLKLIASNYTLNDVSVCPTYRRPFSYIAEWPSRTLKLPSRDTQRTINRLTMHIPIHLMFSSTRALEIVEGKAPYDISTAERINKAFLRRHKPVVCKPNPITIALKYQKMYEDAAYQTMEKVGEQFGVSRVRIHQMLNLLKLDERIIDYILNIKDPRQSNYWNEHRLRSIARLPKDKQFSKFQKMINS